MVRPRALSGRQSAGFFKGLCVAWHVAVESTDTHGCRFELYDIHLGAQFCQLYYVPGCLFAYGGELLASVPTTFSGGICTTSISGADTVMVNRLSGQDSSGPAGSG